MKSSGTPFKYLFLLLVKFWNLQSCRRKEVGKVWPVLAIEVQNAKTMPTSTFLELFLSQNHPNGSTRFIKGVPIDGPRKARIGYDL